MLVNFGRSRASCLTRQLLRQTQSLARSYHHQQPQPQQQQQQQQYRHYQQRQENSAELLLLGALGLAGVGYYFVGNSTPDTSTWDGAIEFEHDRLEKLQDGLFRHRLDKWKLNAELTEEEEMALLNQYREGTFFSEQVRRDEQTCLLPLFRQYDADADGYLSPDEFHQLIRSGCEAQYDMLPTLCEWIVRQVAVVGASACSGNSAELVESWVEKTLPTVLAAAEPVKTHLQERIKKSDIIAYEISEKMDFVTGQDERISLTDFLQATTMVLYQTNFYDFFFAIRREAELAAEPLIRAELAKTR